MNVHLNIFFGGAKKGKEIRAYQLGGSTPTLHFSSCDTRRQIHK